MSFADLLRQSRSSPTALLHQFLTNYDPNQPRVYAFVEGEPDRAFYRAFIEPHLGRRSLFIYNCEGKRKVFDTYAKVIARHPECRNVLFFVDKDVDDLSGIAWPSDPRVFTTELYSVENYVVNGRCVDRYFADFIKIRHVALDLSAVASQFDSQLTGFQRAIAALMCWVIACRRNGTRVVLSDLKLERLFTYDGTRVARVRTGQPLAYLSATTEVVDSHSNWVQACQVCRELRLRNPKRYIRGKFEAWFLIEFVKKAIEEIERVAREGGGKISVATPLHDSNFIQVLVRGTDAPAALDSFLRFHLQTAVSPASADLPSLSRRLRDFFVGLFRPR